MNTATFERFVLELPDEAVEACSHQGACDADVEHWAPLVARPPKCTPEALRRELADFGAWEGNELSDDDANWKRLVWIAASNVRDGWEALPS